MFTAVIEKCKETGLFVAYIPGIEGAHTQGASIEEAGTNLKEVLSLLSQDSKSIEPEAEFIGTYQVAF